MAEFDLGLRCDYLLTMADGSGEPLRDYFVGIKGNKITAVKPWSDSFKAKKLIGAKNQIVLPGLVNGHTHLAMTLFRGLADDLPFNDWLYNYILPLESRLVDRAFVRAGAELSMLECIRAGVTTVCDMYFFEDEVADVIDRAGLRALVCEALTDFPTPDDKTRSGEGFRILDKMRGRYSSSGRIIPCVGPHAPYTCSDDTLIKAREYAAKHNVPIVIHVSETRQEVEESLKKHGKTPVQRLYDLGLMKGHAVFAHCVHVTDADIALMAKTKTAAIYNPESNMKLGAGVAPVPNLLKAGVHVGIGTDGSASNNDLNIFREMDAGAKIQKLTHADNTAMTALQVLRLATIEGARALGLGEKIGSIEEGKLADIICLDANRPHMQPIHNVISQLVYSASGTEVETVICDGKVLMEMGETEVFDLNAVYAEVAKFRDKIQESLP